MRVLPLFEIMVPVCYNTGERIGDGKHFAFETIVMTHAGGFTRLPDAEGSWRTNARVQTEQMRIYRISCDADTMRILFQAAARVYADQAAFFVAEIGRAWVVPAKIDDDQLRRYTADAGALSYKLGV